MSSLPDVRFLVAGQHLAIARWACESQTSEKTLIFVGKHKTEFRMSEAVTPVYAILGAAGGIGAALARILAAEGASLALGGRTPASLEALTHEVGGLAHTLDATQPPQVEAFLEATVARYGRLDGVVNCVGSILLKPAHLTSEAEFEQVIATNLTSAFGTVKAGAKLLRRNGGSIVLLASAVARAGFANHEAIAAAKAGVIGLALSAAATYASSKIRVNVVAPGLVRTPLAAPVLANEASEKASREMHALNRIGEPEQVADMIAFLLNPRHDWITGQVFGVDGGLGTVRPRARV
jgi:NAD(P)-dependent dehydrogenase (short-subunit alcohol dehydrogenase family)